MIQVLAMIFLGMLVSASSEIEAGDHSYDLAKWVVTDPPAHGSRRWVEAHGAQAHWVVTLRDGQPRTHFRTDKDRKPAPLPFTIGNGKAADGLAGRRVSARVADGWIVGFDAGEFGGGLWWFSPDGSKRTRLLADARIKGLIPTGSGLLALEGLAHMNTNEGRLLRLEPRQEGAWSSEVIANLGHAPEAYATAEDGSLIVATTDRLLRVEPLTGKIEVMVNDAFWEGLHPNSMVIDAQGTIYLGMRHGVARIGTEKAGLERVRWLLKAEAE